MVDDDFTQPENDGLNVSRLVRRDVQVGVDPDSLIPQVLQDFRLAYGLGDGDVISAAVVKKFRKEPNTGEWVAYYRVTGTLAPALPPQTVTVQFIGSSTTVPGDTPSLVNVGVSIITSDGFPLVAPVQVDVRDLLTGNAMTPADYLMATPQVLSWLPADPDGTVRNATLNTSGANNAPDRVVNLDLDPGSLVGATLGGQTTHDVTIINISA